MSKPNSPNNEQHHNDTRGSKSDTPEAEVPVPTALTETDFKFPRDVLQPDETTGETFIATPEGITPKEERVAVLQIDGQTVELPIMVGSQGEQALDISALRSSTGFTTYDNGLGNTASCVSRITFINGQEGVLEYRGIPIETLCEQSNFVEVSYLLIYGHLPTGQQLATFREQLGENARVHEDMRNLLEGIQPNAHPMRTLAALTNSLADFHPELVAADQTPEERDRAIVTVLAKLRTLAAWAYKSSIGEQIQYPTNDRGYLDNFLHMMFSTPLKTYHNPTVSRALELLFILHADHEQNCSTTTARVIGSSKASLFESIAGAVNALSGNLHGGANLAVTNMLQDIVADGGDYEKFIAKAKDKNDPFRLMGFGHRVYKNFDPRATIIKKACDEVLSDLGIKDPMLEVAKGLEAAALSDPYFIERKLFPNVDFYSGVIYRAIGVPEEMLTVMFALGRVSGWIAHWKELREDPKMRITRPRQIYDGPTNVEYRPLSER